MRSFLSSSLWLYLASSTRGVYADDVNDTNSTTTRVSFGAFIVSPNPFSCLDANRNARQSAEMVRSVTEDCLRESVPQTCDVMKNMVVSLGLGNTLCQSDGVFVYGGIVELNNSDGSLNAPTEPEIQSCIASVVESETCLEMMQTGLSNVESISYTKVEVSVPTAAPVVASTPTPQVPNTAPTVTSAAPTTLSPVVFLPTTKSPSAVQNDTTTQCPNEQEALNNCVSKNMECFNCLSKFRGTIMSCTNLQDNLCNATLQESCQCQPCSTEIANIYNCGVQCGTFSCSSSDNGESDNNNPTMVPSPSTTSLPDVVTDVPVVTNTPPTNAPEPVVGLPSAPTECTNAQSEFSACLTKHQNCYACLEPLFGQSFSCDVLGDGMCAAIQNKTCACENCIQSITKYYDCVGLDKCEPLQCNDPSAVSANARENGTEQPSHAGAIGGAIGGFVLLAVLAFAFASKKREKIVEDIDSINGDENEVPSNSGTSRGSWLHRSLQKRNVTNKIQTSTSEVISSPETPASPVIVSLAGNSYGVARESSYEVRSMLNQDDVLVVSDSDDDIERSKSSLILISTVPYTAQEHLALVTPDHGATSEKAGANRRTASLASSELNTADFEPDESWNPDDTSMGPVDEASVAVTGAGELAFHPLKSPVRNGGHVENNETKTGSPYTDFFRKFLPKTPSCCDDNTLPVVSPQEERSTEFR